MALDISKAFDKVWYAGLLHKLKSYEISGQRFQVVLDGKASREYPVNAAVPQGSILGLTLFLLYINDLSDDVYIMLDICSKCWKCIYWWF